MKLTNEIIEIAARLNEKHGPALSQAASLVNLTEALFLSAQITAPSLVELLAVQREAVGAWLENQGLDSDRLDAAIKGLQQGALTARCLAALPA